MNTQWLQEGAELPAVEQGSKGEEEGEKSDGVYDRDDRKEFWISWTDTQGRRRRHNTDANNISGAGQKALSGGTAASD
jgi:hypothetical protein